jgi:hypothetical protein
MCLATERLRPRPLVRLRLQETAAEPGLKVECNHSLPAARTPGPADYMPERLDRIRIRGGAGYIRALAADMLVPAGDNPVPTVHKWLRVANSSALAERMRLAADWSNWAQYM